MSDPIVEVRDSPAAAADYAAAIVAQAITNAVSARGRADIALSGGRTPERMIATLGLLDLPWAATRVYQVDERVAPGGSDDRNATALAAGLLDRVPCTPHLMPTEADDLAAAALRYSARLPSAFDVVHLGLGDDGHTASLFADDPTAGTADRRVIVTAPHHGHRRMSLSRPVLDAARLRVWLITGATKAPMVERVLAGDPSIPAGRVRRSASMFVLDHTAGVAS